MLSYLILVAAVSLLGYFGSRWYIVDRHYDKRNY